MFGKDSGAVKLPNYSRLNEKYVYQPSDDTFYMIDTINAQCNEFREFRETIKSSKIVIELGCGTGIISKFLVDNWLDSGFIIDIDINQYALQTAKDTMREIKNKNISDFLLMNKLGNIKENSIDLLIFNPPYVPSETFEIKEIIDLSWAGGYKGREVLIEVIKQAKSKLSSNGIFILLLEKKNEPDEICHIFSEDFDIKFLGTKQVVGEKYSIICLKRIIKPDLII